MSEVGGVVSAGSPPRKRPKVSPCSVAQQVDICKNVIGVLRHFDIHVSKQAKTSFVFGRSEDNCVEQVKLSNVFCLVWHTCVEQVKKFSVLPQYSFVFKPRHVYGSPTQC